MRSDSSKRHVTVLACLVICLVALALSTSKAEAHARLVASEPAAGTALTIAPEAIALSFSEEIVPDSLTVQITSPDGEVTDLAPEVQSTTSAKADMPVDSTAGTWIVRWSVISATDGHGSSGYIPFSVGTGRAPTSGATSADDANWADLLARGLWLLVLTAILVAAISAPVSWGVLALLALLSIILPLLQSGADLSNRSVVLQIAAGGLAAASCLVTGALHRRGRWIAIALWLIAMAGLAASGHAEGSDRPGLAIIITGVHLILALTWTALLAALAIRRSPNLQSRTAVERFSWLLIVGVGVLILAGIALAAVHVPGQQALRTTTYGSIVLWKQIAVGLAIALGAANLIVVRPWVRTGDAAAPIARQSHWIIRAEALALIAAVLFGAALTQTSPPARTVLTTVASPLHLVDQTTSAAGLAVNLSGAITMTSDDHLVVTVQDADGQPVSDLQRIIVAVAQDGSGDADRFDAIQTASSPDQWTFSALRLPYPANWSLEVTVRRAGVEDAIAPFSLDTTSWFAEAPRSSTRSWEPITGPVSAIVLVLLALTVLVGGWWYLRRSGPIQPAIGAVIVVALVAIAAGFAIQAVQRTSIRTPDHDMVIPTDVSVEQGEQLFVMLCATCHGPAGQGLDQLTPEHQHGSGTSLIDPATKQRSDGDLYWVLSNGQPATDMPAYDVALTDQDRWNLIAYLRTLQRDAESDSVE